MAIQFKFRADQVTFSLPPQHNVILCSGGTTIFTTNPVVDPISDAVNNVRFVVTGSAPNGDFCGTLMTLRTVARFDFTPTERGRLTATTFFTPAFLFNLTCAGEGGLFELFDKAGPVSVALYVRMSVRVRARNGTLTLNDRGRERRILFRELRGGVGPRPLTGGFAPELMEVKRTRSYVDNVNLTDTVRLRARYTFQAFANDLSTFMVDAGSSPGSFPGLGLGLNVPIAVIRTDP